MFGNTDQLLPWSDQLCLKAQCSYFPGEVKKLILTDLPLLSFLTPTLMVPCTQQEQISQDTWWWSGIVWVECV